MDENELFTTGLLHDIGKLVIVLKEKSMLQLCAAP